MRRIIASINITPDGFCDHQHVIADDEHHHYINQMLENISTVLLGRVTYRLFEKYWPQILGDRNQPASVLAFAEAIDKMEKVVFSKQELDLPWRNSRSMDEISQNTVLSLKQEAGKDMLILGSPSIISEFTRLGLIDEYVLFIQPMMPGKGKHLFETVFPGDVLKLKLTETAVFQSGVVVFHYKPDQPIIH